MPRTSRSKIRAPKHLPKPKPDPKPENYRLTREEQETVISITGTDPRWRIYTCQPAMIRKLRAIATAIGVEARKVDTWGWEVTLPKNCVSLRKPRKASAKQAEHLARARQMKGAG